MFFTIKAVLVWSQARVFYNDPATYGAFSIMHSDGFSAQKNMVASTRASSFSAGATASLPYGLKELKHIGAYAILPVHNGSFRVSGSVQGNPALQDVHVGFSYATLLGKLGIGAQLNYYQVRMKEYGTATAPGAGVAIMYLPTNHFSIGAQIDNPIKVHYNNNLDQDVPTRYSVGIGYMPGEQFSMELYNKYEQVPYDKSWYGSIAFHYKPIPLLDIRGGISYTSGQVWWAAGIQRKKMRLMFSAVFNQKIGTTPGFSFQSYNLKPVDGL